MSGSQQKVPFIAFWLNLPLIESSGSSVKATVKLRFAPSYSLFTLHVPVIDERTRGSMATITVEVADFVASATDVALSGHFEDPA